ncbi:hypothetical protein ACQEVF_31615 [Nonomuraea polychroma]|uniref:hypothetical protein n=1 Tax=Nonomuraea polychroma TaxID=46176 RepID=UPI003D94F2C8
MTTDELVKNTLTAVADQAVVPPGLAQRAWRQRTRRRITTATTAAVAVIAAVTAGTIIAPSMAGRDDRQVAIGVLTPAGPFPTLAADPGRPTPQSRVGAGNVTLAAYASCRQGGTGCSWSMLDPGTGRYRTTPWGWIAVSPAGHTAAVLEGPLPARRIGLVDTGTGAVRRWIDLDRADGGGLAWSPDGRRLLVTTYNGDPGLVEDTGGQASRTGFYIVDAESGTATFRRLPGDPAFRGMRADLSWSRDGSLIWEETGSPQLPRAYYTLNGDARPGPDPESTSDQPAGASPDGRLVASGGKMGSAPFVVEASSGETTLLEPSGGLVIGRLLAWTDDTHLIAWATDGGSADERRFRLVLVDVEKPRDVTPLTGWTDRLARPDWVPVF